MRVGRLRARVALRLYDVSLSYLAHLVGEPLVFMVLVAASLGSTLVQLWERLGSREGQSHVFGMSADEGIGGPAARAQPEAEERAEETAALREELQQFKRALRMSKLNHARTKRQAERAVAGVSNAAATFAEDVSARAKVRGVAKLRMHATAATGKARARRMSQFCKSTVTRLQGFRQKAKASSSSKTKRDRIPDQMSVRIAASAFNNSGGLSGVARTFECHRETVRRHAVVLASCQMEGRNRVMENIRKRVLDEDPDILYAICATMYDETGQVMNARVGAARRRMAVAGKSNRAIADESAALAEGAAAGALPTGATRSIAVANTMSVKQEVCVNKMWLQWLERGHRSPRNICITFPPATLPSTSARHLFAVLRGNPHVAAALKLKDAVLGRAAECTGLAVDVDHSDNASGNDLAYAAMCAVDPSEWTKLRILCMNHQNHLGMMGVFSGAFESKFCSGLYSICSYLRLGYHMLRLSLSVAPFLESPGTLCITHAQPSPSDDALVEEVLAYIAAHVEKATNSSEEGHRQRVASKLNAYRSLFQDWNTGYGQRRVGHACRGAECRPRGKGSTVEKLVAHLQASVTGSSPTTPQLGKWTQLGLCLDWFVVGFMGNFIPSLFAFAFSGVAMPSGAEGLPLDMSEGFLMDLSWKALTGVKKKAAQGKLTDAEWCAKVLILAIVIEPCRFLCSYFMAQSHNDPAAARAGPSPALNCLYDRSSLVVWALQHWSAMVCCPPGAHACKLSSSSVNARRTSNGRTPFQATWTRSAKLRTPCMLQSTHEFTSTCKRSLESSGSAIAVCLSTSGLPSPSVWLRPERVAFSQARILAWSPLRAASMAKRGRRKSFSQAPQGARRWRFVTRRQRRLRVCCASSNSLSGPCHGS